MFSFCCCCFLWIANGCLKELVTAKLAFLLQLFMVVKTTDQWGSSWNKLFNEHRFRASLYIIWLEASHCLWSAQHWIKVQIYCSWCVERPLIILVTEACSEYSVCSAFLPRSNLLKTVNSFGFDTKRRKAQHVRIQTQPSFTSRKRKRKTKWQAHFERVSERWLAIDWHQFLASDQDLLLEYFHMESEPLLPPSQAHVTSAEEQLWTKSVKSHLSSSFHFLTF